MTSSCRNVYRANRSNPWGTSSFRTCATRDMSECPFPFPRLPAVAETILTVTDQTAEALRELLPPIYCVVTLNSEEDLFRLMADEEPLALVVEETNYDYWEVVNLVSHVAPSLPVIHMCP